MSDSYDGVEDIQNRAVCLHDEQEVNAAIDRIAKEMTEKLADKKPILLCAMRGALIFMGQLLPRLRFPLQIDHIHTSRFRGEVRGGDLHWLATPTRSLRGRNVVIIEDILDSGITLAAIKDYCSQQGAAEVYSAVLIDKDHERDKDGEKTADFVGLKVADKFLVGYGLDFHGYLRNEPGIFAVE